MAQYSHACPILLHPWCRDHRRVGIKVMTGKVEVVDGGGYGIGERYPGASAVVILGVIDGHGDNRQQKQTAPLR